MAFVHLHNHSEYSLLDGVTHIKDMVARAAELGMPAIAITDHGVMSGCVELENACMALKEKKGTAVKPIFGCEIYFTDNVDADGRVIRDRSTRRYHMILLAKDNEGYHNLVKLVSKSHIDNFYYKPLVTMSLLEKYGHGLIGTSACMSGIVPRLLDEERYVEALAWARRLAACFDDGDFYIEVQNHGLRTRDGKGITEMELNARLARIAREGGFKLVATNDFHYLLREDAHKQDMIMTVGFGESMNNPNRPRYKDEHGNAITELYMKTEEEMRTCMGPDFQEACDNTIEIAEKCNVTLDRESILPRFPLLPDGETEESYFKQQVQAGLERRYGTPVPADVQQRADYEVGIITEKGFPAYFLLVQEYLQWARDNSIQVGPGRGSAAGAVVAYAMGITDVEPIGNGLMFERFLNPERTEMPDIDCDFEQRYREHVIDHIKELYGEDHVSQVITFQVIKAKSAIKDAARIYDVPISESDRICKVFGDADISIDVALYGKRDEETGKVIEPPNADFLDLYRKDETARFVVDEAHQIEGQIRSEGVHPCATIICRDPMDDHVPMKRDTKGGGIITQFDGHVTPDLGLLKMDFLGLRTLDLLAITCENIERNHGVRIDPERIPVDDKKAFRLLRSCNCDGLFQVEGALYTSLFHRYPPRTFADIVASIALNRPGPLDSGMLDDYVAVATGKAKPDYYDKRLRPILEETYGTIVYQEQLMQISMVMCGFSAGKADKLRKAMGKKLPDVMASFEKDWMQGAEKNGYSARTAKRIWDAALKFAEYAFNKSHSAAYAYLVMRTAYLKAHYPFEFMAALLTTFMDDNKHLVKYVASCNRNGTPVLPPDINESQADFSAVNGAIRFGLTGIRNVGAGVAEAIVAERDANGPFANLHEFALRLGPKCVNRRVLESLIKSGSFDGTGYTRKQLMYFLDETPLLDMAAKRNKDRARGQTTLFELIDASDCTAGVEVPPPNGIEWDRGLLLSFEKEIMNMYVSDHPMRPYEEYARQMSKYRMCDLAEERKNLRNAVFVGMVSELQIKVIKSGKNIGKKMALFNLEDATGAVPAICFSKGYETNPDAFANDSIVKIVGRWEHGEHGVQIVVSTIEVVSAGRYAAPPLKIRLHESEVDEDTAKRMMDLFERFPGENPAEILIAKNDGRKLRASLPMSVEGSNEALKDELHCIFERNVVDDG